MIKTILFIGASLIALILIIILSVYLYYIKRAKNIEQRLNQIEIKMYDSYKDFKIRNPYDYKGKYYKAQLHTHTKESDGKIKTENLIKEYRDRGYNFLAITDHNKITINNNYDNENFITIVGEEMTIIDPFWPLGRHLNRLFVKGKISKNKLTDVDEILNSSNINIINHPATISGLGTQRWDIEFLLKLNNIKFIEINNHFSDEKSNLKYWHILLNKYGPKKPIWALAVDDTHKKRDINKSWVMVKTDNITEKALKEALNRGSFYGTQGVDAEFQVFNKKLSVKTNKRYKIDYINKKNEIVKSEKSNNSFYKFRGDEGFIRIEVINTKDHIKLWSQPFWIVDKRDEVTRC